MVITGQDAIPSNQLPSDCEGTQICSNLGTCIDAVLVHGFRALTITSAVPPNGAADVDTSAPVIVTFDQPVQWESVGTTSTTPCSMTKPSSRSPWEQRLLPATTGQKVHSLRSTGRPRTAHEPSSSVTMPVAMWEPYTVGVCRCRTIDGDPSIRHLQMCRLANELTRTARRGQRWQPLCAVWSASPQWPHVRRRGRDCPPRDHRACARPTPMLC